MRTGMPDRWHEDSVFQLESPAGPLVAVEKRVMARNLRESSLRRR